MPTTIIGPDESTIPYPVYPAVIEIKQNWSDSAWTVATGLELQHCTVNAGAHDLDSCTMKHRYGKLFFPGETAYHTEGRLSLSGWWVRVSLAVPGGHQPIWIGRIYNDPRTICGAPIVATGHQVFQAYGPQMLLRKRAVSESIWQMPAGANMVTGVNRIQRVAPLNDRVGHHGWVIGNQSADDSAGTYIFGGTGTWSVFEYVEYLLYWFMNSTGGPQWTLGGQASLLTDLKTCQTWPDTVTVDRMLETLITPRLGIDYKIVATEDGFEISVFALQSAAFSSGGVALPANPNVVVVRAGVSPANISTTVTCNSDHQAGTIRVMGKPIVVCCSLSGANNSGDPIAGSLMPAWDSSLQGDYVAGVGSVPGGDPNPDYPVDSADRADYCRKQVKYADVFQLYLMPATFSLKTLKALYMTDSTGDLATMQGGSYDPPWQNRFRKTLHWLPLLSGWDYSQNPPVNAYPISDDADYTPQYLQPSVWVRHPTEGYVSAHAANVGVGVPKTGLGVRLHCEPNHLVAKGTTISKTLVAPKYSMTRGYATIAFESDCRLCLTHTIEGTEPGVDGVEEIVVHDAELWVLAPETVLGLDASDSMLLQVSQSTPIVLRNDKPRLAMLLAGAIARYAQARVRAVVECKGLFPWGGLIGQIMTVIDTGDAGEQIDSPITSITWSAGESGTQTVLSTGFARG